MQIFVQNESVQNTMELTLTYPIKKPGKYTSGVYTHTISTDTLQIVIIEKWSE